MWHCSAQASAASESPSLPSLCRRPATPSPRPPPLPPGPPPWPHCPARLVVLQRHLGPGRAVVSSAALPGESKSVTAALFAGPPGESELVTAGVMPAGRAYLVAVISPRSPFTQPNKLFYPTQQMKLQPNKRNYNPTNVNPSLSFLSNALAWILGRFKCNRSCPSHPLQFLPIG